MVVDDVHTATFLNIVLSDQSGRARARRYRWVTGDPRGGRSRRTQGKSSEPGATQREPEEERAGPHRGARQWGKSCGIQL